MEDFESFKVMLRKLEHDKNLENCDILSHILNNAIYNKLEIKQLDGSYYWNCDRVKNIINTHHLSIVNHNTFYNGIKPYINTINFKTKQMYYDKEHNQNLEDSKKYDTYMYMNQFKKIIDQLDDLKKKN